MEVNKRHHMTGVHVRNVPVVTKAMFKSYCASRGYTMQAAVIALLRRAVNENMALPEARK